MNKKLFATRSQVPQPSADTYNKAGGQAYSMDAEHALAQYAATGCFNNKYYASAERQLDQIIALLTNVSPTFIARCAYYSRKKGNMKDMPVFLLAYLFCSGASYISKKTISTCDRQRCAVT